MFGGYDHLRKHPNRSEANHRNVRSIAFSGLKTSSVEKGLFKVNSNRNQHGNAAVQCQHFIGTIWSCNHDTESANRRGYILCKNTVYAFTWGVHSIGRQQSRVSCNVGTACLHQVSCQLTPPAMLMNKLSIVSGRDPKYPLQRAVWRGTHWRHQKFRYVQALIRSCSAQKELYIITYSRTRRWRKFQKVKTI